MGTLRDKPSRGKEGYLLDLVRSLISFLNHLCLSLLCRQYKYFTQKITNTMYFAEMQILFFLIGLGATLGRTLPGNRAKGSFVETPEFSSGLQAIEDFVEKYALSKCDKKQLDEVKESLKNMKDMHDMISKENLDVSTVAGGLFHLAAGIIGNYKDQYPNLDHYTQILDKTVSLAAESYSNMAAILAAAEAPAAGVVAAFSGAKIAKESIDIIRMVFPSLKGSACTDKIENSVFEDVGGVALGGAGIGAAIGTIFFPGVGTAIGAALGGAVIYATVDMKEAVKFCQQNPHPTPKGECQSV